MSMFLQYFLLVILVAVGVLAVNGLVNLTIIRPRQVTQLRLSDGEELVVLLVFIALLAVSIAGCLTLWP